jgi:hypothetical protein
MQQRRSQYLAAQLHAHSMQRFLAKFRQQAFRSKTGKGEKEA